MKYDDKHLKLLSEASTEASNVRKKTSRTALNILVRTLALCCDFGESVCSHLTFKTCERGSTEASGHTVDV